MRRLQLIVAFAIALAACSGDDATSPPPSDTNRLVYAYITPAIFVYVDRTGRENSITSRTNNETWIDVALHDTIAVSVTSLLNNGALRTLRFALPNGAVITELTGVTCERFTAAGLRAVRGDTVLVGGSKLIKLSGMAACPAWSRDGQFFVVPLNSNGSSALYRVSLTNPTPQKIADAPAGRSWFDPAINGSNVVAAVAASTTADNEVWTMNADGTNVTFIASWPGIYGLSFPDANQICGVSTRTTGNSAGLLKITLSDKAVSRIVQGVVYAAWCST